MESLHDKIRTRLLAQAGIFPEKKLSKPLDEIEREQWNAKFERYMRNRLIMGYLRYGPIKKQMQYPKYDNVSSMKARLELYAKTRNREHLVDIANLCMVEFSTHPNYPFIASDDAEHVKSVDPQRKV